MDRHSQNVHEYRTAASSDDAAERRAAPAPTPRRAPRRGGKDAPAQPAPSEMTSLDAARASFIDAVRRVTPGTDLPRYVAVLDALLAWTRARADRLSLRPAAKRPEVIRIERTGTKEALWSAQPARTGPPNLEVHLGPARPSNVASQADTLRTLNAHSRDVLQAGDRLRIGFGALKNAAALAAVIALLDRVLEETSPPADTPA